MTDPIRDALIEDLAYGTTGASGVFVQDGIDHEELAALVDALGLVTDRKLRLLTEEDWTFEPSGGAWTFIGLADSSYFRTLAEAVDAAWKAHES